MFFIYIIVCFIWLFISYKISRSNSEVKYDFYSKIGISVIFLALISPYIVFKINSIIYKNEKVYLLEKLGSTGDFLGGSTVGLLTLASIMFIISTLNSQRESLRYQKEELALSRKEFEKLNDEMKIQQFEHSFFVLLDLYKKSIDELMLYDFMKADGSTFQGKKSIDKRLEQFEYIYHNYNMNKYLRSLMFRYSREEVLAAIAEINKYLERASFINASILDTSSSISVKILEFERQKEILKLFENETSVECFGTEGIFDIELVHYLVFIGAHQSDELKDNIILKNIRYKNKLPYNHIETAFFVETRYKFEFEFLVNNLVNLLDYIDNAELDGILIKNKQFYLDIINAQISNSVAKYIYIQEHLMKNKKLIKSNTDFLYSNLDMDSLLIDISESSESSEDKDYYVAIHSL